MGEERTFVRFNVPASALKGTIAAATVRLRAINAGDGPTLYRTSGTWTESGLNHLNQPSGVGAAVTTPADVEKDSYAEFDVTGMITGPDNYDFAIYPQGTDQVEYVSREGTDPPLLLLTYSTGEQTPWIVGDNGTGLRRGANGAWTTSATGTTRKLHAVWGAGPANVWAVGDQRTVLRYDGTNWNVELAATTANLFGVWGRNANDVWLVGQSGTSAVAFRRLAGVWTASILPTSGVGPLQSVWSSSNACEVFAVGDRGTAIRRGL